MDWSRISPMILAHCGQFLAESKLSGILIASSPLEEKRLILPLSIPAFTAFRQSPFTPLRILDAPGAMDANLGTAAAVHRTPGVAWISLIWARRAGCTVSS